MENVSGFLAWPPGFLCFFVTEDIAVGSQNIEKSRESRESRDLRRTHPPAYTLVLLIFARGSLDSLDSLDFSMFLAPHSNILCWALEESRIYRIFED